MKKRASAPRESSTLDIETGLFTAAPLAFKKTGLDLSFADGSELNLAIACEHMKHGRKVEEALVDLGVPTAT